MNRLSKTITSSWFKTPESYHLIEQRWKSALNGSLKANPNALEHLFYAAIRGKDWRKGFTPISNGNKISCSGLQPNSTRDLALAQAHSQFTGKSTFLSIAGDLLTEDAWEQICEILPSRMHDGDEAYDIEEAAPLTVKVTVTENA